MAEQYFVNRNGKIVGPFTKEAIKLAVSTNKLTADDLVGTSQDGPWRKLKRPTEEPEPANSWQSADNSSFDSFGDGTYEAESNDVCEDYPPLPPKRKRREKVVEDDNPFASIKGRTAAPTPDVLDGIWVASPWKRLIAAFSDGLAGLVFVLPGIALLLFAGNMANPQEKDMSALGLVGLLLVFLGLIAVLDVRSTCK